MGSISIFLIVCSLKRDTSASGELKNTSEHNLDCEVNKINFVFLDKWLWTDIFHS